jgi:hypothetical protein
MLPFGHLDIDQVNTRKADTKVTAMKGDTSETNRSIFIAAVSSSNSSAATKLALQGGGQRTFTGTSTGHGCQQQLLLRTLCVREENAYRNALNNLHVITGSVSGP